MSTPVEYKGGKNTFFSEPKQQRILEEKSDFNMSMLTLDIVKLCQY